MPAIFKYDDDAVKITINTNTILPIEHGIAVTLLSEVYTFHSNLPLKHIKFHIQPDGTHKYEFKTVENLEWSNIIQIPPLPASVLVSFSASGFFNSAKLIEHRLIRDELVFLVRNYGLTDFEAKW